jgi:hypothetical protein
VKFTPRSIRARSETVKVDTDYGTDYGSRAKRAYDKRHLREARKHVFAMTNVRCSSAEAFPKAIFLPFCARKRASLLVINLIARVSALAELSRDRDMRGETLASAISLICSRLFIVPLVEREASSGEDFMKLFQTMSFTDKTSGASEMHLTPCTHSAVSGPAGSRRALLFLGSHLSG